MSARFITCNNLQQHKGIKHGFFTRNGGVSNGVYASLNCGQGSNDNADNVKKNRSIAMQALGFLDQNNLYSLYQVHSNKVLHINSIPSERYEYDALVTNTKNIALGILTADCTPILFFDHVAGVIGAAHAGWKGACGGIIENTIDQMIKLGSNRKDIIAAIGPTIAQKSYETGQEFYDRFLEEDKNNTAFFVDSKKEGHYMFNLPAYVATRLEAVGISNVEDCGLDTCANREDFFSYRRNCLEGVKDYGRNLSVIVLT